MLRKIIMALVVFAVSVAVSRRPNRGRTQFRSAVSARSSRTRCRAHDLLAARILS